MHVVHFYSVKRAHSSKIKEIKEKQNYFLWKKNTFHDHDECSWFMFNEQWDWSCVLYSTQFGLLFVRYVYDYHCSLIHVICFVLLILFRLVKLVFSVFSLMICLPPLRKNFAENLLYVIYYILYIICCIK